ncbi:glycerol-3-phosphate dehydrogenase subunit GlpB [Vibrio sp. RC27]
MKYDVIVIGGGMAGYCAAIRALELGQKTALINNGRSALHFASGSIDVLSTLPCGDAVQFPYQAIEQFPTQFPTHPYAKLGANNVESAIEWFTKMINLAGVPLHQSQHNENHWRITTLGALSTTFLSQPFVEKIEYQETQPKFERVVVLSLEDFRDFQANVAVDNLKSNPRFNDTPILSLSVSLNNLNHGSIDVANYRSSDFIRLLKSDDTLAEFANQISLGANKNDLVIVPAIFGTAEGLEILTRLKAMTGISFNEIPTMPPSLMGVRLEEALERQFITAGGVLLKGDCVTGGEFVERSNGLVLNKIWTRKLRDYALSADTFVLASGSFFSNGLRAEYDRIIEPVFGFDVCTTGSRDKWYQETFFSPKPHAFMSFGLETNEHFNPSLNGATVSNVHCCGSVLAHYNPIAEGSGGGVAISTAYYISDNFTVKQTEQLNVESEQC